MVLASCFVVVYQLLAESKQIRLKVVASAGHGRAAVDKQLFARLLDNLIANAVKFAPDDTTVTVRIKRPEEHGMWHRPLTIRGKRIPGE